MRRGIVIGCDQKQEWMLTWWWSNYQPSHQLPVAFIDFGMSLAAKQWCRNRGFLIPLKAPKGFVFPRALIPTELCIQWENRYGAHLWHSRSQWFYKPFALMQSPFQESIWLDLDCEILGSLMPLFHRLHQHSCFAIARDNTAHVEEAGYNSGVIVYDKETSLLEKWASACMRYNDHFLGDQEVLTDLVQKEGIEIAELPGKYNWVVKQGINAEAIVLHWAGSWGKQVIQDKLDAV